MGYNFFQEVMGLIHYGNKITCPCIWPFASEAAAQGPQNLGSYFILE
jgi:hypothetical protein